MIRAKVSRTLQNSKPSKDNLSKDERKALKELQPDTSILILPADKGRSNVILNPINTGERGLGGTMYHRGIFLLRTLERQMILNSNFVTFNIFYDE